jgi:hypothetical protein
MNEWGSAEGGGRGKACREQKNIVMMLPGQLLPVLLTLPVSSIQPSKKYMLGLASLMLPPYAVETSVSLEAQNRGGQRWSTAKFTKVRDLTAEERTQARGFADTLKQLMLGVSAASTIDA